MNEREEGWKDGKLRTKNDREIYIRWKKKEECWPTSYIIQKV